MQPTILGIGGSRRHESVNRRLLAAAGRIVTEAGAGFTQLDWASRPGTPNAVFRDKPVGLLAASPGGLGGLRALYHLRDVLTNLGALVLPRQYALGRAGTAFGPDNELHPDDREAVASVTGALLDTAGPIEGVAPLNRRGA